MGIFCFDFELGDNEIKLRKMIFITSLGSTWVIVILGLIMFWIIWKKESQKSAWLFFVTIAGGAIINNILKIIIKRPRPTLMIPVVEETGYSFPSGHTMNATIFYLSVAFILCRHIKSQKIRGLVILGALLLIFSIGFSRVYLGVHYLSDVLGGFLLGIGWLVVVNFHQRFFRALKAKR